MFSSAARPSDTEGGMGRLVRRVLSRCARHPRRPSILGLRCRSPLAVYPGTRRAASSVPCLTLLRTRFTEPTRSPWPLVVSYTTVSPLPPAEPKPNRRRFTFCGTVSRVAPGGCYPPSCSMEPGRSSASAAHKEQRMTRPSCRPIPSIQPTGSAPDAGPGQRCPGY